MKIWCEFIDIRNLGLVVGFLEIEVFSSCVIRFIVKVLLVLRIRFLVDVFKGTSHELGICGECNYVIVQEEYRHVVLRITLQPHILVWYMTKSIDPTGM